MATISIDSDLQWRDRTNKGPWNTYVYQGIQKLERTRIKGTSTKIGNWRPPTNYHRYFEEGLINQHHIQETSQYTWYRFGHPNVVETERVGNYTYNVDHVPSLPTIPSWMIDHCIMKARNKLLNQNINLAQAFGERAQTVKLITSSLKRITQAGKAVKRLDFRSAQDALGLSRKRINQGTPFEMWLELQYGWKPLLNDVYGSLQALDEKEQKYNRSSCYVTHKTEMKFVNDGPNRKYSYRKPYYRVMSTGKGTHKVFIRLDFLLENPFLASINSVGLLNPAQLAWELLPFSFVADWWLPVGQYISCLTATAGWSFRGGSLSTKTEEDRLSVEMPHAEPDMDYINRVISGKGRRLRFDRYRYYSAPLPERPHFNMKASGLHIANGIALAAQVFGSGITRVR